MLSSLSHSASECGRHDAVNHAALWIIYGTEALEAPRTHFYPSQILHQSSLGGWLSAPFPTF